MATLKERTEEMIKTRANSLREASEALKLIELLPKELQEIDGEADTGYYGQLLRVSIWAGYNKDIDLLKFLKTLGVQKLAPKMIAPDSWAADGEFAVDGKIVGIHVYSLPKPLACHIEEYQETVTKYRAICDETGDEIK